MWARRWLVWAGTQQAPWHGEVRRIAVLREQKGAELLATPPGCTSGQAVAPHWDWATGRTGHTARSLGAAPRDSQAGRGCWSSVLATSFRAGPPTPKSEEPKCAVMSTKSFSPKPEPRGFWFIGGAGACLRSQA